MDQSLPVWLSKSLLTEALSKEEGTDNIVVTHYTASPAAPAGNNYGSCILRVRTEYKIGEDSDTLKHASFVIKSAVTEGPVKELFEELDAAEPIFYKKFISEANMFEEMSFIPKNFYSSIDNVIILEDLKEKGYLMVDRTKQLDFDHCKLYIVHAATLHAVSVAVHKENPEILQSMCKERMYSDDLKGLATFKTMIRLGLKCFEDRMKKIDRFKKYSSVVNAVSGKLCNMIVEAHKPIEGLNTINQGDPWATNMMFRYDDKGKVCGMKLLDFQILRYASPVNDLMFFIWTSANHEAKQKLDELYRLYVDSFNSKLKHYKCTERLSYADLMKHVKKLSCLALFISASSVPIVYDPEPVDMSVFSKCEGEDTVNPFERYYDEKYCSERLPLLLADLESAGVFEHLAR